MNLQQCIGKTYSKETCGTTSEEVLELGNDKGKIPLLFKLFLETSQIHSQPHGYAYYYVCGIQFWLQ